MLVVVVVNYALAWLPLHVMTLVGDKNPHIYNEQYVHVLWLFAQLLAFSNAASNPVIYGWMNPKFRSGYCYVLHKIYCINTMKFRKISFKRTSTKEMSLTATPSRSDSRSLSKKLSF